MVRYTRFGKVQTPLCPEYRGPRTVVNDTVALAPPVDSSIALRQHVGLCHQDGLDGMDLIQARQEFCPIDDLDR